MHKRLHRNFFAWLFFHVFEFWYYYIGALLALVALHYFQSQIPLMAKELGDKLLGTTQGAPSWKTFLMLAIAILIFRTLSRLLFFYPARVQQKLLRMEIMERMEKTHPRRYDSYNEGQIFQIIINDFNRLRGLVGFGLLQVGNIVIAATIFVPKIREFEPDFLIAFSPLFIGIVFFMLLIVIFQPYAKKEMELNGEVQNFIIESYEAKATIQNYHSEKSFYNLFKNQSWEQLRAFYIGTLGRSVGFPLINLGVGACLLWAAQIVYDKGLEASALIFFTGFLYLVIEPLMFISWIGVVISHAIAAWGRIKDLLKKIEQKSDVELILENEGELKLWDKRLDLDIPDSKWTVLVGETGVGKSFLLERIADKFIKEGKTVSMVHQEPYLYNDTIYQNIFLSSKVSSEREKLARKLLTLLDLDILVSGTQDLLQVEVGENGKKVSGGQAKRIALVRSLLSDVDVILWDDPFSSVDLILEKQILNELKKEDLSKKTYVLTSHRLTTVRFCDLMVVLSKDKGVEAIGDPQQLLKDEESIAFEYFKKQLV
jgi:ATP-binding cassette subfamily B multidrug efflux pump